MEMSLKDYILEQIPSRSLNEIKSELLGSGFTEEQINDSIQQVLKPRKSLKIVIISIILALVVILLVSGYIYFFIINPSFVKSPDNPKPPLPINDTNITKNDTPKLIIKPENIIYLLNSLGVYKLHNSLNGEPPIINYLVSDFSVTYSFSADNNEVISIDSNQDPDVIISSKQKVILDVYDSEGEELKRKVNQAYNEGDLSFNQIKDQQTLALKGYFVLLEAFTSQGEESAPTAPDSFEAQEQPQLLPPKAKIIIWIVVILVIFILVILIIKYAKHHKLEKEYNNSFI